MIPDIGVIPFERSSDFGSEKAGRANIENNEVVRHGCGFLIAGDTIRRLHDLNRSVLQYFGQKLTENLVIFHDQCSHSILLQEIFNSFYEQ
jgi:hypothetical protein